MSSDVGMFVTDSITIATAMYADNMTGASPCHEKVLQKIYVDTIGDRLRAFATAKNEGREWGSLTALAVAIGISKQQLGGYVADKEKPGSDVLASLRGYGLSIDWLLTGEGEMMVKAAEPPPPSDDERALDELADRVADKVADKVAERMKIYSQSEWGKKMKAQRDAEKDAESGEEIAD